MLPTKTFLKHECILRESDFDVSGEVKLRKVMELMQDIATEHADNLGFGWDDMSANGLYWIVSKVKIVFDRRPCRDTRRFFLYTWPIAFGKLFVERRFTAVDEQGNTLFRSSTLWMMADKQTRKLAPSDVVTRYYKGDFDGADCGCDTNYARLRKTDGFSLRYRRTIRRSDLDINRHVNNTAYVNFAVDALGETERVNYVEIVYHKELRLNDEIDVYLHDACGFAEVLGERSGELCFTVKLGIA